MCTLTEHKCMKIVAQSVHIKRVAFTDCGVSDNCAIEAYINKIRTLVFVHVTAGILIEDLWVFIVLNLTAVSLKFV